MRGIEPPREWVVLEEGDVQALRAWCKVGGCAGAPA